MFVTMEKLGNLELNGLEFLGLYVQRQLSKPSLCTEYNVSIPRKKGIHKNRGSIMKPLSCLAHAIQQNSL